MNKDCCPNCKSRLNVNLVIDGEMQKKAEYCFFCGFVDFEFKRLVPTAEQIINEL